MFRHLRPVWAEIDLDNLAFNMQQIKSVTSSEEIIAVVKADGYGHGALDIVPTLLDNGANGLAVAVIDEAIELRKGGVQCPIMILGFTNPSLLHNIIKYDIQQTVFTYDLALQLSQIAEKNNKVAKIHIAVDTGMRRIGFLPNEKSIEEVYKISKLPNIVIEGLFSHFSTADEFDKYYSYYQLENYNWFYREMIKRGIKVNKRHIANSAAIIDMPYTHFEAVRAGIILYGYYPSDEVTKNKIQLKPVMSLKTNVVHIKTLPKGEYISYGRKFVTQKQSVIATLPVGYADGYTRLLGNKAKVIIKGKFAPIVGRICMDQCMIDITEIPNVSIGDEVILMGEQDGLKFTAEDFADALGTISYEVTCMISKRVPRVYIKDDKVVKVRNFV